MNIVYTGPRAKEFGIVGNATGTRYRFTPGQPTLVDDADCAAILAQYPGLFAEVKPAPESESKARKAKPVAEVELPAPEATTPEVAPGEQE